MIIKQETFVDNFNISECRVEKVTCKASLVAQKYKMFLILSKYETTSKTAVRYIIKSLPLIKVSCLPIFFLVL